MTHFDLNGKKRRLKELDEQMGQESFWDSKENAQTVLVEHKKLTNIILGFAKIEELAKQISELTELDDESMEEDLNKSFDEFLSNFTKFENTLLFTDEFDSLDAIIDIHPGAGGVESQDWAEMLYRMYSRWAEKNNFKITIHDHQSGEEAGIKSVSFKISGENIYGLLKGEKGVHRLVRISPFDSNERRHTSFASVIVTPDFAHEINIDIEEKDLRIDTYRSQGAGGQNVNKTESAVRITHLPTGIVVSCQTEKSQLINKETAMKMLKNKLYHLEYQKKQESISDIVGHKVSNSWGSQIRNYVFCPYTLVKDNRTDYSSPHVQKVMDGDIDEFLYSYLRKLHGKD